VSGPTGLQVDYIYFNYLHPLDAETPPAEAALLLQQNYPNPFNPATTIDYHLPERGQAMLDIYNASGRLVTRLVGDEREEGWQSAHWDGRDTTGRPSPSGVYFYYLTSGGQTLSRKMVLIR
jgi:hypothetical protein